YYHAQAVKALEGIPEITNEAPADVATMYVRAKLGLGQVLYENKKFDQMEALATSLQKRFPNFKNLDANYRKDLHRTVDALVYYSQFGRAQAALNAGNVAEARKIADPVLGKVRAQVDALKAEETEARKALDKKQDDEELKERHERLARNYARDMQLM